MRIVKISIEKFRGFKNVEFKLGSHLTVISGQNGTQKTTLLGLLTQPFTITEKDNPMLCEKPLSGGNFKSAFSDKFKISKEFDKAGEHEWKLFFDDNTSYEVESINRDKNKSSIRFWKKGDKSKDSGYRQFPVIFLSLKRLLPIGEDSKIKENTEFILTDDEKNFFKKHHNEILFLTRGRDQIESSTPVSSKDKQTLGVNTKYYDWQVNSAGQDNIGKILLAILSFKRLEDKFKDDYKGGILAIDEVDTAFYPGSQIKLLVALNKFAANFDIQIIFTTHSLTLLKEVSKLQNDPERENQVKLIFLKREDHKIIIKKDINYDFIKNDLNRTLSIQKPTKKIAVYTEDKEGIIFVKSLLGTNRTKKLNFIDISLGHGNLIELSSKKVPSFIFPNSIIILDGDVKKIPKSKKTKNILLLPTEKSPEVILAKFLDDLKDDNPLWANIDKNFDHGNCFEKYFYKDIKSDRTKAKKWFNEHKQRWGRNVNKVLGPWKKENQSLVKNFCSDFDALFKNF